jgi:hypothetical protein
VDAFDFGSISIFFLLLSHLRYWVLNSNYCPRLRGFVFLVSLNAFMRWRSWLRHCATNRNVVGSIPDGVTGIFHWHNRFGRTMSLGSTQPLNPGLDGAWLGSFYVINDVLDKESYSNAPCNRPGAARLVIGGARLVGSPQTVFSRSSMGLGAGSFCGYTALAVYAPSQSRPILYTLRSGLCFLLLGCAKSETYCPTIGIG